MDERQLSDELAKFGKILSCRVNLDQLGYSRGSASVVFFNESDANNAIAGGNGMQLKGKKIRIKSEAKREKNEKTKKKVEKYVLFDQVIFKRVLPEPPFNQENTTFL